MQFVALTTSAGGAAGAGGAQMAGAQQQGGGEARNRRVEARNRRVEAARAPTEAEVELAEAAGLSRNLPSRPWIAPVNPPQPGPAPLRVHSQSTNRNCGILA